MILDTISFLSCLYASMAVLFVATDLLIRASNESCGAACGVFLDSTCHSLLSASGWTASLIIHIQISHSLDSGAHMSGTFRHAIFLPVRACTFTFELYLEIMASLLIGTLVDVDHFLAASQFSYDGATHLSSRPFGHTLSFPLILALSMFIVFKKGRVSLLVFAAITTHLLRDAVKHGVWVWPIGTTSPITVPVFCSLVIGLSVVDGLILRVILGTHYNRSSFSKNALVSAATKFPVRV